eukprot:SAG25_NODE_12408_length_281_cov_1.127072_1_plen_60_part_10
MPPLCDTSGEQGIVGVHAPALEPTVEALAAAAIGRLESRLQGCESRAEVQLLRGILACFP